MALFSAGAQVSARTPEEQHRTLFLDFPAGLSGTLPLRDAADSRRTPLLASLLFLIFSWVVWDPLNPQTQCDGNLDPLLRTQSKGGVAVPPDPLGCLWGFGGSSRPRCAHPTWEHGVRPPGRDQEREALLFYQCLLHRHELSFVSSKSSHLARTNKIF